MKKIFIIIFIMLIFFYTDYLFAKEYCQHSNNFKKYILYLENSNNRRKAEYKYFICNYSQGYLHADIIPCKSFECDCINNQYVNDVCEYFLSKHEYKLSHNKISYENEIAFNKKYDEFNLFTEFNIGDKFYCADTANIIPVNLIAFVIQMQGEGILTFKLRFEVPDVKLFENIENNYFKYFIISNNPNISTIRNNLNVGKDKIDILISEFKDNIIFPGFEPKNYGGFPPYLAIFEGSFSNQGEKEYIISYYKDPIHFSNVFGICIVNNNGKVIKELTEMYNFESDLDYKTFIDPQTIFFDYKGIIYIGDLDNDGIDELIIENYVMVGSCIQIWKNINGTYKKISCGFCIAT